MTDTGERPVLLAVDPDDEALARTEAELSRRYGEDYEVVTCASTATARVELEALRDRGEPVAVVLAADTLGDGGGSELLADVRRLHPRAKRALLIDWGSWREASTTGAVLRAMALGQIDYYAIKPWRTPDEQFHRLMSEFIYEWCRANSSQLREITLIADERSPRAHDLRSILARNGVPYAFHAHGSEDARRVLDVPDGDGGAGSHAPVVVLRDGRTIEDPSNAELAQAFGVQTALDGSSEFDLIVVGAGPAGLAAAVYASSEGLETLVVERESIGGQAGSTSLIRNYLGFSRGVSGGDLAQRAYQQAWVFGTKFLMMRDAIALRTDGDRHVITVGEVGEVAAPVVVLATGVSYRRLGVPALDALTGAGVFYGAPGADARGLAREHVHVVGGGNSAGQAAIHLARSGARVTLLVRGGALANDMSRYLYDEIEHSSSPDAEGPGIEVRLNTEIVGGGGEGRLERLELRDRRTGHVDEVPATTLFVLIGARPHTGWLPDGVRRDPGGYVLTGADVTRAEASGERAPLGFETSVPGIFAVGDVRHSSVKRVAAAVGQGAVAIQQAHELLAGSDAAETREPAWR